MTRPASGPAIDSVVEAELTATQMLVELLESDAVLLMDELDSLKPETRAVLADLWARPVTEQAFPVPFVSWDAYLAAKYEAFR